MGGLYGLLPVLRGPASPGAAASAFVVARLVAGGEELGLETRTSFAEAGHGGASWGEQLTLCLKVCGCVRAGEGGRQAQRRGCTRTAAACVRPSRWPGRVCNTGLVVTKWRRCSPLTPRDPLLLSGPQYRDLPCDTHLVLNVWQVSRQCTLSQAAKGLWECRLAMARAVCEQAPGADGAPTPLLPAHVVQVSEGAGASLVGTAALALFSKKGRLKTGVQQLHVREGCDVAVGGAGASGGDGGSSGDGAGGSSSAAECSGAAAAAGGVGHSSGDSVVRRLPPLQLAAKARVAARAEAGQLVHLAALYARGDVPRCSWLDALTSKVSSPTPHCLQQLSLPALPAAQAAAP